MEPRKDQMSSLEKAPDLASLEPHQATPKKRFRIVRLEERIAPGLCHYNPRTMCVGGGANRTQP
jgi:hypothetical protein